MAAIARFRLNSPHVVSETVDGEAIIVNLENGTYYSIKGDGILLWNAIIGGAGAEELVDAVAKATGELPDRVVGTITDFYETLAAEGLIVRDEVEPDVLRAIDLSAGSAGLLKPSIESYSDMQDLILLDPVHEVDERGWPHVQANT